MSVQPKDFAYIFLNHTPCKNTIVIPTHKYKTFNISSNPYIDLSNIQDLNDVSEIILDNHYNGKFTLTSSVKSIRSIESNNLVKIINNNNFPKYTNRYTNYSPKIYGSINSPLLPNEHITLQYKDNTIKKVQSHTPKAFNLSNELRYAIPLISITGEWNCKLLINGIEQDYVQYTKQFGHTYITFNNSQHITHNKLSGSSKYLSDQQLKQSINFSRIVSLYLVLKDTTSNIIPTRVNIKWWYYIPMETTTLLNKFLD